MRHRTRWSGSSDAGHLIDFPHVRAGFGGSTGGRAGPRPLLVGFGLAFLAVILLRTAWVSDAAYLTLRTVEHAASGFGVRWNVDERVQTYDHPLWLLLLLAGRLVTGETYFTTLGLSVAASIGCAWIVMREAGTDAGAVLALAALGLSPLFVSFSTSGLESPLLHLLTAGIVICAAAAAAVSAPRRRVAFAALVGLAALTRWTIWLAAGPAFIALLVRASRETRVVMAALALVPLGSWLLWAWWYCTGTWGSNAWLADHTAAAWSVRAAAGWSFLQGTARLDLLLVEIAAVGVLVGLAAGGMRALLALGAVLQGAWVVAAGGSPMAGRDLTVPYLIGLILIVWELRARRPATVTLATVAVIAVAAAAPHSTIAADASYGTGFQPTARTHDARAGHYQATGLLLENRFRRAPVHPEAVRARQLAQSGAAVAISAIPGIFGAAAGPTIHVIESQGPHRIHCSPVCPPLLASRPSGARRGAFPTATSPARPARLPSTATPHWPRSKPTSESSRARPSSRADGWRRSGGSRRTSGCWWPDPAMVPRA